MVKKTDSIAAMELPSRMNEKHFSNNNSMNNKQAFHLIIITWAASPFLLLKQTRERKGPTFVCKRTLNKQAAAASKQASKNEGSRRQAEEA